MSRRTRSRADVCVVGAGFTFTSGISYYTDRLIEALDTRYVVFGLLVRRLIPARLYPGGSRVGRTNPARRTTADTAEWLDWYWGPNLLRAVSILVRRRPRIIVLQWWTGALLHTYLVLSLLARLIGSKLVIEFHEVQDVGEARLPLVGPYVRAGASLLVRLADAAVIHSESDRAPIVDRYRFAKPLVVIPHGPYEHHEPKPVRRVDDDPFNFLYFGVIRPFKGVEDFVRAFDGLEDELAAGIRITIAGETWENWTLPGELIAASRRRDRISFVNHYLSDDELAEHLGGADAIVLPYHRSSASGPLHTAMSAGLPVIVSAVGGLPEAAGDYEGVTFVAPHEPAEIGRAMAALRDRGRQRFADPHSWDTSVREFARLFAAVDSRFP